MYYPHVISSPAANFFTPEECEFMLESAETIGYELKTFVSQATTEQYKFHCAEVPLNQEGWADYIQRITTHASYINNQTWQMDVTNIEENQLYIIRLQPGEHHIQWHMDCTGWSVYTYSRRKISFAFNLTPINTYTGGELEFIPHCQPCIDATKDVGSGLFFPAYRAHRITPVESGHNYL